MNDFYSSAAAEVVARYMQQSSGSDRQTSLAAAAAASHHKYEKPWINYTDPGVETIEQLQKELSTSRLEAQKYKSEAAALRSESLCAKTRALDAEKCHLDLQDALKQSNNTVENLREVVLSQEAKIASLQSEYRMSSLREQSLEQELKVAQENVRTLRQKLEETECTSIQKDLAAKSQPTIMPLDSAYSETFGRVGSAVTPVSELVCRSGHTPSTHPPAEGKGLESVQSISNMEGHTPVMHSKERTDALLHQVDALKQALNLSIEKRRELSSETSQLASNFESSLDSSQQTALDATSDKWRANLQQTMIETEHAAYSERIRSLEGHVLKLQAQNQALKAERLDWLPPAVDFKAKQSVQNATRTDIVGTSSTDQTTTK